MLITGKTQVFAVLGDPVSHSASPVMHNAWFAHHKIDGVYVALTCRASGASVVDAIRALGLAGVNLTLPLKQSALPHLDHLDPAARACGAANTVVRRDGRMVGYNTDIDGFIDGLREAGIDPQGRRVAILGAGGAARAVATGLKANGAGPMRIFNRSAKRALSLVHALDLDASVGALEPSAFSAWPAELVVQTLPGAARAAVLALPTTHLPPSAAWCDLNYWDPRPPHLRGLEQRGITVQTGHAMLLHQAARAFGHFTGTAASIEVGRAALRRQETELVSRPLPQ